MPLPKVTNPPLLGATFYILRKLVRKIIAPIQNGAYRFYPMRPYHVHTIAFIYAAVGTCDQLDR